jgi:hypothetical protein
VLGLSLLAGVTAASAQSGSLKPPDRISVERRNQVLELAWSDTEDRLQGSLQPELPRKGEPLKVFLNVGSFYGPAFDGPITITLREAGSPHGPTQTVTKGEVNWSATFVPERTGSYQLDVSFRTTRLKVLHAELDVTDPPVPRFVLWALVGLVATVALGYGIRSLMRKDTSKEPHPILAELAKTPAEKPPEKPSSL